MLRGTGSESLRVEVDGRFAPALALPPAARRPLPGGEAGGILRVVTTGTATAVERTGPAILAALQRCVPQEAARFGSELREALERAGADLDVTRVDEVMRAGTPAPASSPIPSPAKSRPCLRVHERVTSPGCVRGTRTAAGPRCSSTCLRCRTGCCGWPRSSYCATSADGVSRAPNRVTQLLISSVPDCLSSPV